MIVSDEAFPGRESLYFFTTYPEGNKYTGEGDKHLRIESSGLSGEIRSVSIQVNPHLNRTRIITGETVVDERFDKTGAQVPEDRDGIIPSFQPYIHVDRIIHINVDKRHITIIFQKGFGNDIVI